MRIWYQSLADLGRAPGYFDGLAARGRAIPTTLIDAGFADVSKGLEEPARLVAQFTEAARRAIGRGAEALIPGQLYLSEAIARAPAAAPRAAAHCTPRQYPLGARSPSRCG